MDDVKLSICVDSTKPEAHIGQHMSDTKPRTVWRFWNKTTREMTYGLGVPTSHFEDPNYLAMRRVKSFDSTGGELFDCDVVLVDGGHEPLIVDLDARLVSRTGQVTQLHEISSYVVVGQDPMRGLQSERAKVG